MQVTLIPRGQARGLTWFTPGEDPSLISKSQIFARIVSALGGRAAEQVIFGDPEITTGASGDLQQVPRVQKIGQDMQCNGLDDRHSLLHRKGLRQSAADRTSFRGKDDCLLSTAIETVV